NLRLRGLQLTPELNDVGARLVADVVNVQPLLAERLFVETDRGIFRAALIDRHRQLEHDRIGELMRVRSCGNTPYCTLYWAASVGNSAPSAILICSCATSTPYKAAMTEGFSAAPAALQVPSAPPRRPAKGCPDRRR